MSDLTKLGSLDELEAWFDRSRGAPVWIFKHSLTCPISDAAFDEFRAFAGDPGRAAGCAMIEVQTARPISDELSRRTGVRHESPQALLLRDGEVVWHASHWRVQADRLRRATATAS